MANEHDANVAYLQSRGWFLLPNESIPANLRWLDPLSPKTTHFPPFTTHEALSIQQSRDAAEERAAWDRYAAAAMTVLLAKQAFPEMEVAQHADEMMRQRRLRWPTLTPE